MTNKLKERLLSVSYIVLLISSTIMFLLMILSWVALYSVDTNEILTAILTTLSFLATLTATIVTKISKMTSQEKEIIKIKEKADKAASKIVSENENDDNIKG